MTKIHIKTLPEDLVTFIDQVLDEWADERMPEQLPVLRVRLEDLPSSKLVMSPFDDRGPEYAKRMIGEETPPIICAGNILIDGRHRLYAARAAGLPSLEMIDLGRWIVEKQIPQQYRLGEISMYNGHINDISAMNFAQQFINEAPDAASSAEEYSWEFRNLTKAELDGTWLFKTLAEHSKNVNLDPSKSDLSRPVIVSHQLLLNDGRDHRYCPIDIWDGVHRLLSAITLGVKDIPAAIGRPIIEPPKHEIIRQSRPR